MAMILHCAAAGVSRGSHRGARWLAAGAAVLLFALGGRVAVAGEHILHPMGLYSNDARMGSAYGGAVRGPDGSLYVASGGQLNDGPTLFKIDPDGNYVTLHWFNGGKAPNLDAVLVADGSEPVGTPIIDADGVLYGVTASGGPDGGGVIYRYVTSGEDAGDYSIVHGFTGNGADGSGARSSLILGSDDALYLPLRAGGGSNNRGTLVRVKKNGQLKVLINFSTQSDEEAGAAPQGAVTEGPDGALYGVTTYGGSTGQGTLYKVNKDGSGFAYLGQFTGGNGANPVGPVAFGNNGKLYGTTTNGGPVDPNYGNNGKGTVFRATTTGSLKLLYTFYGDSRINGDVLAISPQSGLVLAGDGKFYGVTSGGGGRGTVLSIDSNGVPTTMFSFTDWANGIDPQAVPTVGADGKLYATTTSAGVVPAGTTVDNPTAEANLGSGTVFRLSTSGSFKRLLTADAPPTEGRGPSGALVEGSDGKFYGVTLGDAKKGAGTIYRVSKSGDLKTLYVLSNDSQRTDGYQPSSALVEGAQGTFYGVASVGGSHGVGSVFRVDSAGTYTTLYSFTGGSDGNRPTAALTLGKDGLLYGSTEAGGANGYGSVFRLAIDGSAFQTLHAFTGSDGQTPRGKLLEIKTGLFFGTTLYGGDNAYGVVYSIDTAGTFAVVHRFDYTSGANPVAGVIKGADGAFYGTTGNGGAGTRGNAYRITKSGNFSVLHDFTDAEGGIWPQAPLLLASDGNFYGTAYATDFYNPEGVVYRLSPKGKYAVIHTLSNRPDGYAPEDELIQAKSSGDLMFVTRGGGEFGFGAVLSIDGPPDVVSGLSVAPAGSGAVLSWTASARAKSYNVYLGTSPGGEGKNPVATDIAATEGTVSYTVSGLTDGTPYYFTVTAVNKTAETQPSAEVSVTPAPPTVSFSTSSGSADEGGSGSVKVRLSTTSAVKVTVPVTITGTATNGVDYTLSLAFPLKFKAGQTTQTIDIATLDDALSESDETVKLTLGTPTAATLGANTKFTYTIIDNDP